MNSPQNENKLVGKPKLQDEMITGFINTRLVFVGFKQLIPEESRKVIDHSPDGFSWGYGGSGPAQLSLAILMKFMPVEMAKIWYQKFKREVVAPLDLHRNFQLPISDVENWIAQNINVQTEL